MRYLIFSLSLLLVSLTPLSVQAKTAEGYWLTENKRAVIRVATCDEGLCGTIHWIIKGGMQYDSKNPDKSLRDTPMCGLKIIWGFDRDGDDWEGGKIYKADEGDTYNANITVKGDETIKLRGYVGIPLFGKSQTWTRVTPEDYPACK